MLRSMPTSKEMLTQSQPLSEASRCVPWPEGSQRWTSEPQPLPYNNMADLQKASQAHPKALSRNVAIASNDNKNNEQSQLEDVDEDRNTESTTYIGRAHYLCEDTPIDEASSRAYPAYQRHELSETGATVLQLFKAFELPSRSTRQSLIDNFIQFCHPWTPILSRGEMDFSETKRPSLLVTQALFLAASRVCSASGVLAFATPEQFYQRAKSLFYMNHEKDPLAVIKATIMLQWYTPDGPEHVSYDAGEFWLKIGVGIAFQVGLHKETSPGGSNFVRRRLWWSLVVSVRSPTYEQLLNILP